jgi:hypothetical protein
MRYQNKFQYHFIYLFALILLVASCKSIKSPDGFVIKKRSTDFLLKRLNQNKVELDWLSARAKIDLKTEDDRISASANIRFRKDSVIWMTFKKLGIEGARVLIDQDSIYILDRLNKQYAIKGYDYIDQQFNLSALSGGQKVDFSLLQNFLLGNPQFFVFEKIGAEIAEYQYRMSGDYRDLSSEYWIDPVNYFLTKMFFSDTKNDRSFTVDLGNYQALSNKKEFAYLRKLNVNSKETGDVSVGLKFSNVEINTVQTIRFSIPSRYKRVE